MIPSEAKYETIFAASFFSVTAACHSLSRCSKARFSAAKSGAGAVVDALPEQAATAQIHSARNIPDFRQHFARDPCSLFMVRSAELSTCHQSRIRLFGGRHGNSGVARWQIG